MDDYRDFVMKVVMNNLIPVPGFAAINIFGICFVRKTAWERRTEEVRAVIINHESIHTAQMRELLYIGFYVAYLLEWVYRLVFHTRTAYEGISFEREAYAHQEEPGYLATRRHFAQWRKA